MVAPKIRQYAKVEPKGGFAMGRSRYSAKFKAAVALEAIKGQRTANELALATPLQIPSDPLAKYPPFISYCNGWGL